MDKTTHFLEFDGNKWPNRQQLAPYFLTPAGRRQAFDGENDYWGVSAEGVEGTGVLQYDDRIDIHLGFIGKPDLGVLLHFNRWSQKDGYAFYSKGDLSKLYTLVKTKEGGLNSMGLFLPFDRALDAIVEFIESDGALSTCIEWIAPDDLPDEIFPEPEVTLRG